MKATQFSKNNWKKIPKDGRSRGENLSTQPLSQYPVFNNPEVIPEGWYPAFSSSKIKKSQILSFVIGTQRLAIFRGKDGKLGAVDAFCPHMGADLNNGSVVGNELRCYFHRWQFGADGRLTQIACKKGPQQNIKTQAYPVEEKYGFVWVFARPGTTAPYPVPTPPGLEGEELIGTCFMSRDIFVHHHVMMVGGIDLQHFSSVHGLDIKFDYEVKENELGIFDWRLSGEIPRTTFMLRLARKLIGDHFSYLARFAGGSVVSITYGPNQKWFGGDKKIPPIYLLWGCLPHANGISHVHAFVVQKKRPGFLGWIKKWTTLILSMGLLAFLHDDDVQAYPRMRFNPRNLIEEDRSSARLIQLINTLKKSSWGKSHAAS